MAVRASQAMLSMDNELIRLTKEGKITKEAAQLYAVNPGYAAQAADLIAKRFSLCAISSEFR